MAKEAGAAVAAADAGTASTAGQDGAAAPTPTTTPDAAAAADAGKVEGTKAGDVPETYTLTLPEGFEAAGLDQVQATFVPVARELGLSNDAAQKLVDLYGQQVQAIGQQQAEAWQQQVEAWRTEAQADPEIGGAKLPDAIANGKRVLQQFGDKALTTWIEDTHLGDHPAFLRFMDRVGRAIKEDSIVISRPGGADERSIADKMYGKK